MLRITKQSLVTRFFMIRGIPPMTHLRPLFLLRDDMTFLNHGSFGACPRLVFEDYQRWQLELERQPVEFMAERYNPLLGEARAALAEFLGTRADNLVYVPNATAALNLVARSLPLQAGDEVLSTDHEYGAIEKTWQFACARRGAVYRTVALDLPAESQEELLESVWRGVNSRTKVLALSHITSPTGMLLPVAELIRRARAAGILTVIDGAHAPGQIDLALDELGADFYAGNCHKWLLSPKGAGFLYARPQRQELLQEPLVVSWGWQAGETPRLVEQNQFQGTRDIAAWLSVPAAIRFQQQHDWPQVRRDCHALLQQARAMIPAITGLPPLYPPDWHVQMLALPLPPCDLKEIHRRLWQEFRVEIPIMQWRDRQLLRISAQGYNCPQDLQTLREALAAVF
jgi:isopenicillin-N epimerase